MDKTIRNMLLPMAWGYLLLWFYMEFAVMLFTSQCSPTPLLISAVLIAVGGTRMLSTALWWILKQNIWRDLAQLKRRFKYQLAVKTGWIEERVEIK